MSASTGTCTRLLIVSRNAGGVSDEVQRKLERAFPAYAQVEWPPRHEFTRELSDRATVLVAGGDGTIGHVARALAGSKRRLGILPLGTYNNFSRGLKIPQRLEAAIATIRSGVNRPVTMGRINGRYFLEAAAVGMFGEAILLGEHLKEGEFGQLGLSLRAVSGAEPFDFEVSGDLEGQGRARSLVFTNTPSTGARMPIGRKRPTAPFLELSIGVGSSRSDILKRMLASAVRDEHAAEDGISFRFGTLRVRASPRVSAVADNHRAGRTPVTVSAAPVALHVFVPG